jgi:hypothetical protein
MPAIERSVAAAISAPHFDWSLWARASNAGAAHRAARSERDHSMTAQLAIVRQVQLLEQAGSSRAAAVHRFVLAHGKAHSVPPHAPKLRRGRPKNCFANALRFAGKHGALYAEGFAFDAAFDFLFHHAWCLAEDGMVIDPTLGWRPDHAYFGVTFAAADACALLGDRWGLLRLETIRDAAVARELLARMQGDRD